MFAFACFKNKMLKVQSLLLHLLVIMQIAIPHHKAFILQHVSSYGSFTGTCRCVGINPVM